MRAFESPFASLSLLLLPVPSGESRAQTVILLLWRTWDLGSEKRHSLLQATQLVREPASDLGLWTQHAFPSKGQGMGEKEGGRKQKEGRGGSRDGTRRPCNSEKQRSRGSALLSGSGDSEV